ncbi:MAG: flavoredoxin [Deinococcus-Thermus bacterium]|nr:flavoredoxin [Deinococcota bacterium]
MSERSPRPLTVTAPVQRFFGYYPGVPTVLTAAHEGDRNLLAVGWHAALSSDPPMYGVAIAEARYTHRLGVASGAFAVHVLPFAKAREIAGVGTLSKHQGVDKFARFALTATPGVATGAPILHDAYLAYECRLRRRVETGDHEWWVGEVVALHHDPDAFDERGIQRRDAAPAPVYYGRATYESLGAGELAVFPPDAFPGPGDDG